jgi:hypothetical protein
MTTMEEDQSSRASPIFFLKTYFFDYNNRFKNRDHPGQALGGIILLILALCPSQKNGLGRVYLVNTDFCSFEIIIQ